MSITKIRDLVNPELAPILVLKVGSALLVGKDGSPRREWLATLVAEIAEARARGQRVVVVSSGSIALGAMRLRLPSGGRGSLAEAQASAAVGQIELAGLWASLLGDHGITAAQMLLTLHDLEDRRRYLNAAATIGRLLKAGVVPVINENDSVATHEIRFGDNDRLAARVAQAAQADAVVLLSDIDGLYDRDPAMDDAQLLPVVDGVDDEIHAMASADTGSGMGTGGMTSKLQAAEIAQRAGISLAIVAGLPDRPLSQAVEQDCGTMFLPQRKDGARKAWLGARQHMEGVLVVDAGCINALKNGNSLLAAGILSISGQFQRGDPVIIHDQSGNAVAQGLIEYKSLEVERIKGRKSQELEALLGYSPRSAVIHRDHLVML